MRTQHSALIGRMINTGSAAALAMALLGGASASAQTASARPEATPAQAAGENDTKDATDDAQEVTVTGSRISRAGYDQPTPTTVIGDVELRQGARANIAQVLNDTPQFRATVSPTVSVGNTNSGTAPVDLRGLGTVRTLTLFNGRRFVGTNNLNLIPTNLVQRVEVVTGGASAAWGSNAVSGVVNIILDKEFTGLSVGGSGSVSSRGDAARYTAEASSGRLSPAVRDVSSRASNMSRTGGSPTATRARTSAARTSPGSIRPAGPTCGPSLHETSTIPTAARRA